MLAATLRELSGTLMISEDGDEETLDLLPPATPAEVAALEADLPCPLPPEIREALSLTTGFANSPIDSFSLLDLEGFGLDDVFPHAYSLGHDGFGNYWVLDLLPETREWGPVFFACHDPPVIAYQAASLADFARQVVAMHQPGPRSPVDQVHEEITNRIYAEDPCVIDRATAAGSSDPIISEFASGLDDEAVVVDLREARLGDGFNWGRFGPRTDWVRCGSHRVWAATRPERRSVWAWLLGR